MLSASEIRAQISDHSFLETIFQKEVDWDTELDARDADGFTEAWTASYDQVNAIADAEDTIIAEIRESVFKQVFRLTQNPDLAGYVSDDFGLVAMAFENKMDLAFITALWESYTKGIFPSS